MISRLINPHFGIAGAFRWMIVPLLVITIALATMVTTQSGTAFADTGSDTPADSTSTAKGYEPNLWLKCLDKEVEEGDDYRLEVRRKGGFGSDIKTMRVYWYTDPITADETDYHPLDRNRQASNGYQSRIGEMGRDFYTRQDQYPEIDETFKVRFDNSVDYGDDDYCIMTITDDDTPGIYDLNITSNGLHTWIDPFFGLIHLSNTYIEGDVIKIEASFSAPVTTRNPSTGRNADYAGIQIEVGDDIKIADLLSGDGTDTLTFGYTVRSDDYDDDGISILDGDSNSGFYFNQATGDTGLWTELSGSTVQVNRLYHGLDDQDGQTVH